MTANIKLKESYEVEAKYGSFFTGGNVEWLSENILLCQKESSLQFLDLESGSVTHCIGEGDETVEDSDTIHTFTSNAVCIVSAHKSGLLKLWRHDGVQEKMWKSIHKGPVSRLCLDTDSKLASGGSDGIVRIWDIKFQACTHSLKGCQGVISVVAFHPKEGILFAAGDDTKIHSWNLTTGNHIHEYAGHFSKITSLTFTNDSKQMVSSSRDKVLILWNISQNQAVRTIPVFESVETVLVLPDKFKVTGQKFNEGLFVATAGEKGIIRLWNLHTNKEIFVQDNSLITPAKEDGGLAITKLLYQADKKQFAVVSVDHNIILYTLKTFECAKQFVGFSDEILDACFLGKTDEYLAVASNSADIKLYEVSNMNCKLLQGHTDIVLALCKAITEPNLLLSSSKDNTIRLWRILETSEVLCMGVGARHTGSVGSVAFSKSSATFAVSVSQDTCLKMWEIPLNCVKMSEKSAETLSLECLRTEIAHQKDINCVTISPNDKIIATGSQDKLCKLWDENLQLLGVLRGHKRGIWCAKFSPVDQVLITSSADCTIKLWSIQDLNCLKTLEGHESSVLKLEFLSNGMQIMSAGADGLLKVFSVKSSECNMTLDQHEGRVWALALNSDENTIFSGGSDSLLVKWKDVTLEKKLEKAKQQEEEIVQVQQLANLVQNNELLKALKLSLRLDRPFQTLKIVQGIIKKGDSGLADTVKELSNDQKESLLKCAANWNTNSKYCQPAQLVINILINEVQSGEFRTQGLRSMVEGNLGYTDRHFKRLTQLMQDLYFINYTVNCMQPHAKNNV